MVFDKLRGAFAKKVAGGVLALGALGAAEQVGENRGEKIAVTKQSERDDVDRRAAVAEALARQNSEEARVKKQEELQNQFLDNQVKIFRSLEKPPEGDDLEDAIKREKDLRLKILNDYQSWLRANSFHEMFNSIMILDRLPRGIFNQEDAGVGIKGIQKMMDSTPDFDQRVKYLFDNSTVFETKAIENLNNDRKITKKDYASQYKQIHDAVESLHKYCTPRDVLKKAEFIANQDEILKKLDELYLEDYEVPEGMGKKAIKIQNNKAIDYAMLELKGYTAWFRANSNDEAYNSVEIIEKIASIVDKNILKEMIVSDPEFKSRVSDTHGVLIKLLNVGFPGEEVLLSEKFIRSKKAVSEYILIDKINLLSQYL